MILVRGAEYFRNEHEPSFFIGNYVMLNSGGPVMIVVDFDEHNVVAAWQSDDSIHEHTFPGSCVHRHDPASDKNKATRLQ